MTGPEHYAEAERLLTMSVADNPVVAAEAQVHATLALAAATAMNDNAGGMGVPDWDAWRETVSVGWKPLPEDES